MLVHVLDENRLLVGTVGETLTNMEFVRRWQGTDSLKMEINRRRLHAASISNGRYLYLPEEGERLFYVEQILSSEEAGLQKDQLEVHARGMEGPTCEERLVDPRPAAYDTQTGVKAETAMKHYVSEHAGAGAAVARRFDGLVIAADQARGVNVNVEARFQKLADILRQIGLLANVGWEYTFDPDTGDYVFEVLPGVDRSASVFLDIAFDTLQRYEELHSLLDSKTYMLVAGQGEGVERELVDRHADGMEKSGFARREAFIDARDVPPGSPSVLSQRGDAALGELRAERRYEAEVHAFGSFRYRTHWDLGDVVLLRNEELGLAEPVRTVSVTTKVAGATAFPSRTVELGRAMPTLKERVNPGVSSVSAGNTVDLPIVVADYSGRVVQVRTSVLEADESTTGTAWANSALDLTFTPQYADSVLLIEVEGECNTERVASDQRDRRMWVGIADHAAALRIAEQVRGRVLVANNTDAAAIHDAIGLKVRRSAVNTGSRRYGLQFRVQAAGATVQGKIVGARPGGVTMTVTELRP